MGEFTIPYDLNAGNRYSSQVGTLSLIRECAQRLRITVIVFLYTVGSLCSLHRDSGDLMSLSCRFSLFPSEGFDTGFLVYCQFLPFSSKGIDRGFSVYFQFSPFPSQGFGRDYLSTADSLCSHQRVLILDFLCTVDSLRSLHRESNMNQFHGVVE